MTDSTGKLSDEEKNEILEWLTEKTDGNGFSCSVCQKSSWFVADQIVAPTNFSGNLELEGEVYPQAMVICKHCAHTIFLNSAVMGIKTAVELDEEIDEVQEVENG